jgi:hypothetical protein
VFRFGHPDNREKSTPPAQPREPSPSRCLRRKRPHTQMELERSSSPPWSFHQRLSHPSQPSSDTSRPRFPHALLSPLQSMPPTPPHRYPGDGLDYRRPISSLPVPGRDAVIDLTDEDDSVPPAPPSRPDTEGRQRAAQRLPRSEREIIHLDEDDDAGTSGSPDVQFISSRPLGLPRPNAPVPPTPPTDDVEFITARTTTPGDWAMNMLLSNDNRRVAHLRQRIEHIANLNARPPSTPPRMFALARRGRGTGRAHPQHGVGIRVGVSFRPPGLMDFDTPAFDVATGNRTPAPPTYHAPPPAPEGFTRSPGDQGPLICPNCERELCTGDSEVQRQVWIIKGCGHVSAPPFQDSRRASH